MLHVRGQYGRESLGICYVWVENLTDNTISNLYDGLEVIRPGAQLGAAGDVSAVLAPDDDESRAGFITPGSSTVLARFNVTASRSRMTVKKLLPNFKKMGFGKLNGRLWK